jgi:hypothetical protein
MSLKDLFLKNYALKNNASLSSRLMAFCSRISEVSRSLGNSDLQTQALIRPAVNAARMVYETN